MTRILSLAAVLLLLATVSYAAVIDNFNGSIGFQEAIDYSADSTAVTEPFAGRTLYANKVAGAAGIPMQAAAVIKANGFFAGSAGTDVIGITGADYSGLWNLSSGNATWLSMDVLGLEDYVGTLIRFFINDTNGKEASLTLQIDQVGTVYAALDSFNNIGNVNRTSINLIGFRSTQVSSQDLALDNFETGVVPEPATYAMMAAGLIGLYAFRRKRG